MKVIGFNFTKITAERSKVIAEAYSINNHIEFMEIDKESIDMVKDLEPVRIKFKFSVQYEPGENKDKKKEDFGSLIFEGVMLLVMDKEQSNNLVKAWKKKELSNEFKLPLFNLILKKCTPKALDIEEQLGLPSHIPIPRINAPAKKE